MNQLNMASQVDSEPSDLFSGDVEDSNLQLSMPSSPSLATQLQANFTASSQASSEAGSSPHTWGLSVWIKRLRNVRRSLEPLFLSS